MRLQIQLDAVCTINQYNQGYCKSAIILPMLVYVWADGVYSGLRAEQAKLCLVIIGVNERGEKRFLAIEGGCS